MLTRIGATLLAALVALALCEVALRVLPIGPKFVAVTGSYQLSVDPLLGYELAPGAADGHAKISSAGLRDKEYALEPAAGQRRILLIGDSVVFGYGVAQNEALSELMERNLNDTTAGTTTTYDVLNLGVEGYNSAQIARRFSVVGTRFHPDLVVYVYCLNDPEGWDNTLGRLVEQLTPAERREFASRLGHESTSSGLRLVRLLKAVVQGIQTRSPDMAFVAPAGDEWQFYNALHEDHSEGWQRAQHDIAQMAAEVRRAGARFVGVIVPLLANNRDSTGRYAMGQTHAKVRSAFEREGASVLDLAPLLTSADRPELRLDEFHLSADGLRLAAGAILDFLQEHALLAGK